MLRNQYFETLTKVINKMSQGYEEQFKNFLRDILDTLKGNLLPEMKQYQDSVKIILCISRGSAISAAIIMTEIVPILINTFSIAPVEYKPTILKAVIDFSESFLRQNNQVNQTNEHDTVLSLCFQSVSDQNENLRKEVFNSFNILAFYLPEDIRKLLYKIISQHIVISDTNAVKNAFNEMLLNLSTHHGNEIEEIVSKVSITDSVSLDIYLTCLCKLATLDRFRGFTINTFIKLMVVNTEFACIVIKHIRNLVDAKQDHAEYLAAFNENNLIGILLEFSLKHISETRIREILSQVAFIIQILLGCQDSLNQRAILDHWMKQLCTGLDTEDSFVILIYGLVLRLNREIEIDWEFIKKFFSLSLNGKDETSRNVAAQLLANIVNKKTLGE